MGDAQEGYDLAPTRKRKPLERGYWRGMSDEEITAMFKDEFGYPPEYIRRDGGGAFAGPIEEADDE